MNTKIRWAPPMRPILLKRLYDSDAAGFRDIELCDEVGISLFVRCRTFVLVSRQEVECPVCRSVFKIARDVDSTCPNGDCGWSTTHDEYIQSVHNYDAHTGRALTAFQTYYLSYPNARTYQQKILLIDQLIHSFHIHEKTGVPVKSVASKLLEGNKKEVVRFLDNLSAIHPESKEMWRCNVAITIDQHMIQNDIRIDE
ncbi:MAG: hypothetical protein P1S60_11660 [Anaerolineae bacterium]|nr:hypothetical protein [Anaerolineae bacterium]